MSGIVINHDQCIQCGSCVATCPFDALSFDSHGKIEVSSGCKSCKACMKACPVEAISYKEEIRQGVDKDLYKGVLVYVEHTDGQIHPVTIELIGKAIELVKVTHQKVYALFIGYHIQDKANELLKYGVDQVLVYDHPALEYFKSDIYTNVFEDAINYLMPSSVLVGATTNGRCLAPRVAVRFRTGLTADTTILQMRENTDLVQIRPAFGGNIMAQIITTNTRPQFATVRYKVFDQAKEVENPTGVVEIKDIDEEKLISAITIEEIHHKQAIKDISNAEIIVVCGNGVKDEAGIELVEKLAKELNAVIGYTRPMIEKGVGNVSFQIGLSGRTVKPKLIVTVGVSGAIQFISGMQNSGTIVSINNDPNAPIFNIAHYAVVGDLYQIIPELIQKIQGGK